MLIPSCPCPNPNPQITEVWLKYVRPWRYQFDVDKGQAIAQPYSATHVEFVRSNAIFYTVLIQAVLSQTEYMDLTYDRRVCVRVGVLQNETWHALWQTVIVLTTCSNDSPGGTAKAASGCASSGWRRCSAAFATLPMNLGRRSSMKPAFPAFSMTVRRLRRRTSLTPPSVHILWANVFPPHTPFPDS